MISPEKLAELASCRGELESTESWPARQMEILAESSVFGWLIPQRWGGSDVDEVTLLRGYLDLSEACLTTAFILTQFNSAVQKLVACQQSELQELWLPRLARGECFTTVGLSHLTTSRSRGPGPAVLAQSVERGYRLTGKIPWVTGAIAADLIVVGGTLPNGEQILAAVPSDTAGLSVGSPLKYLGLTASQTGPIALVDVFVPSTQVVAGPMPEVMKSGGRSGTGSLSTSALALGAARASLQGLREESRRAPDLEPLIAQLAEEGQALEQSLLTAAEGEASALTAECIRAHANSYVTRVAQCYLASAKGTGFVQGHPAERAVREAMFFYVWSCPQPVVLRNLRELANWPNSDLRSGLAQTTAQPRGSLQSSTT